MAAVTLKGSQTLNIIAFKGLSVLYINQRCQSLSHISMCSESVQQTSMFKESLGTCNVGIALLFWGEVVSTDYIMVYLGQGVFSSSSGLFTAYYIFQRGVGTELFPLRG